MVLWIPTMSENQFELDATLYIVKRPTISSMRVCLLLCLVAACSFPRPADVPDMVSDAAQDAGPGAPPDVGASFSCTPNEFVACESSSLQRCNTTGDGTISDDCGVPGCNADAKRCNQ